MTKYRFVRDPIHSFVSFKKNGLTNEIIDTAEFQRLKYISQLGLSYFTYPSGVHSRFSHSLGAYWISKRLSKKLKPEVDEINERKLSLAALLHDIGHGPFSHSLEGEIMTSKKHEQISTEIIESKDHSISTILENHGFDPKEISEIISSTSMPKYLRKLISSQIDVDRLDYLLRDSLATGNPHGAYDLERIIHTIKINDNHDVYISKGGWAAVEHYLTCRYQMYKQLYTHHSTLAAEELIKNIIRCAKHVFNNGGISLDKRLSTIVNNTDPTLTEYLDMADFDILSLIREAKKCKDSTLSDLSNRFFERRLFKQIIIGTKNPIEILEIEEKIRPILEKKGHNPDFHVSFKRPKDMLAYKPYEPRPKDPEERIFIDPECVKDISEEVESLNHLKTINQQLLFVPGDCKEEIEKVL